MPCPPGYKCVNQFCVPQRCQGVDLPGGRELRREHRPVRRPLRGRDLPAARRPASRGRCIDCNDPQLACTAPQICIGGRCKTDPCLGVTCDDRPVLRRRHLQGPVRPGQVRRRRALRGRRLPARPVPERPLRQGQFCNPLTGEVRDRPLPGDPVRCGHGVRVADQHLQARSLPDHSLPERLLDLQGHDGRHRHLHRRQRQVRAGQHRRRPEGRRQRRLRLRGRRLELGQPARVAAGPGPGLRPAAAGASRSAPKARCATIFR